MPKANREANQAHSSRRLGGAVVSLPGRVWSDFSELRGKHWFLFRLFWAVVFGVKQKG